MRASRGLSVAIAGVVLAGALRIPTTHAFLTDRAEGRFQIVAGATPTPTPTPTPTGTPTGEPTPTPTPTVQPTPTPTVQPTPTPTVQPTPTPTDTDPPVQPEEPGDEVIRVAGPERIATAIEISRTFFQPGVPVAYLATDRTFPDALTGGAAAGIAGGPILLTRQDEMPAATLAELERLAPGRIVILGGPAAVSDGVEAIVRTLQADVVRMGGAERIETAALISAAHHPDGSDTVYLATAGSFPDALSGGAAAARDGAPVLLVDEGLPAVTAAELQRLRPAQVVILGGIAAVTEDVELQVAALTGAQITRLAGADRYATSAAIAETFTVPRGTAFMATGEDFPDALAGVPAAASASAPILLTRPAELPLVIADQLIRLDPTLVVILGGTQAVTAEVEQAVVDLVVDP